MEEVIEKAIQARRVGFAKKLITQYLSEQKTWDKRIQCADWYRRLGLYQMGYRLIAPLEWKLQPTTTDSPDGIQRLWCARFLNLLGGTHFALKLLDTLQCTSAESYRIVGNIHLCAYEYEKALENFKQASVLEAKQFSYLAKLGLIGFSDSLSALGRYAEAFKVLDRIEVLPEEFLLKGIILQAKGEYLARQGDFSAAEKILRAAIPYYPTGDSPDHGILYKWLGYVEARLGQKNAAKAWFKKSLSCLKKPEIRAEAWLDVYYFMDQVQLLPKNQRTHLILYPELPFRFVERSKASVSIPLSRSKNKTLFWISLSRQEWRYRGVRYLGIPKEIHLLYLLRITAEHGCHLSRIKCALWPDELGSFLQLDARIFQLINRLKKTYKLKITVEDLLVFLSETSLELIELEFDSTTHLPTFFDYHSVFTMNEFALFYTLKKTQASLYLKKMIESKQIIKIKDINGSRQSYRIQTAP